MIKFYKNLSKVKKVFFWLVFILLSMIIGSVVGLFLGLVSTTVIPMCCNDNGCHNCFEFYGMIGYEATGVIGFFVGIVLGPVIAIVLFYRKIHYKIDK